MKKEKSCGAVIYRINTENAVRILLDKHVNGNHWSFVKGHEELGETEEQTAIREILEETGLTVRLDTNFRVQNTYSPKPNVEKDVIYFAARAINQEAMPQKEEVLDLRWLSLEDASEILTFESDRLVLSQFKDYIEKKLKSVDLY